MVNNFERRGAAAAAARRRRASIAAGAEQQRALTKMTRLIKVNLIVWIIIHAFGVSGEVARRRLRHSVLLFFMTPARLWREMGRRLGRHVDKANNGYGGEGPRSCW